jgi:hypothetical protein
MREVIKMIVSENPGINGSEISAELRERGVPHQKDEHRPVLGQLVSDGELAVEKGPRGAKKYSLSAPPPPDSDVPSSSPSGEASNLPHLPPLGGEVLATETETKN